VVQSIHVRSFAPSLTGLCGSAHALRPKLTTSSRLGPRDCPRRGNPKALESVPLTHRSLRRTFEVCNSFARRIPVLKLNNFESMDGNHDGISRDHINDCKVTE